MLADRLPDGAPLTLFAAGATIRQFLGEAVLRARPEVAEIRMSMLNKHHFAVDLSPFGMANENEVFYASDRPFGLIEGTVTRDDAPEPGFAW